MKFCPHDQTIFRADGNVRKSIELTVVDRQRTITLSFRKISTSQTLSAVLCSLLTRLILKQGLAAHFGRADHKRRLDPMLYFSPQKKQRLQ